VTIEGNFLSDHKDPAIEIWPSVDPSEIKLSNNAFVAPSAQRIAEFKTLEQEILCRLSAAFSGAEIGPVMQEAQVSWP
jgi:hypothetical protein